MKIQAFYHGLLDSNSYVVYNEESKECMIVDLGVNPYIISSFIEDNSLSVKYLVLTHGHYDHANYIDSYVRRYPNAKIICHKDEIKVLSDPDANVSRLLGENCVYNYDYTTVSNGDILSLGDTDFKVLNFPGHTPGCICLLDEKSKSMITGDVIFAQGIGRTDFKYGNPNDMSASLRQISKLDRDIIIYPGHGGDATLESIFG